MLTKLLLTVALIALIALSVEAASKKYGISARVLKQRASKSLVESTIAPVPPLVEEKKEIKLQASEVPIVKEEKKVILQVSEPPIGEEKKKVIIEQSAPEPPIVEEEKKVIIEQSAPEPIVLEAEVKEVKVSVAEPVVVPIISSLAEDTIAPVQIKRYYGLSARVVKPTSAAKPQFTEKLQVPQPPIVEEKKEIKLQVSEPPTVKEVKVSVVEPVVVQIKRNYGLSARVVRPTAASVAQPIVSEIIMEPEVVSSKPEVIFTEAKFTAADAWVMSPVKEEKETVSDEEEEEAEAEDEDEDEEDFLLEIEVSTPSNSSNSLSVVSEDKKIYLSKATSLETLSDKELLAISSESARRATSSLVAVVSSFIDAVKIYDASEEKKESQKSLTIAMGSAREVFPSLKTSFAATEVAWNKGFGNTTEISSTDQYLENLGKAVKSVVSSKDVTEGYSKTFGSLGTSVTELGTATGLFASKINNSLSTSEKWKMSLNELGNYLSVFISTVAAGTSRFLLVGQSKMDKELPPPPPTRGRG